MVADRVGPHLAALPPLLQVNGAGVSGRGHRRRAGVVAAPHGDAAIGAEDVDGDVIDARQRRRRRGDAGQHRLEVTRLGDHLADRRERAELMVFLLGADAAEAPLDEGGQGGARRDGESRLFTAQTAGPWAASHEHLRRIAARRDRGGEVVDVRGLTGIGQALGAAPMQTDADGATPRREFPVHGPERRCAQVGRRGATEVPESAITGAVDQDDIGSA